MIVLVENAPHAKKGIRQLSEMGARINTRKYTG